ncbi:MAG: hypothetical protein PHO12_02725 [Bacteroidales bacterium]|nr:hypothetical protein [Bacteroidales bacterium]MDD4685276.1 hypothetical protein [Bacteroidales bacterium]
MKTLFKVHYSKIVFISIIALFCSLTSNGQNYAKEFLKNQNDSLTRDVVYLYVNPVVTYRNESINKIEGFDKLDKEIQNDLLSKYAPLINKIKDSLILSNYTDQLRSTLASLGFKVYLVSNPSELPKTIDPTHHTLNAAQIEVEEFSLTDSLVYEGKDREVYYKLLNGVRFNSWLVYNEADTNSRLVFYIDQEAQDFFDGEINIVDGSYFASYDYEKIRAEDAYLTANLTGTISAQYFFNFLMNKYVWIKSSGIDTNYYGIDTRSKKIISEGQPFDNFDIVDY